MNKRDEKFPLIGLMGFTLVELLACIAIVAILAAVVLATLSSARLSSKKTVSIANLHTIGVGISQYVIEHKNTYPSLSSYGYHSPYWSEKITAYLPPPSAIKNQLSGNAFTASVVMMDPLLDSLSHHNLGDYGGNTLIFIPPLSATANSGKSVLTVNEPSRTVMVMSAGQPYSGRVVGCWQLVPSLYFSGNPSAMTVTGVPNDRDTGAYYCLFADGHTAVINKHEFAQNAVRLLTP
jgi:prepilin-type N-terminal cleavage/methylation domain-containing protein